MSKTQFSQQLFEQLGGTNWVARPGYFANQEVSLSIADQERSDSSELAVEDFEMASNDVTVSAGYESNVSQVVPVAEQALESPETRVTVVDDIVRDPVMEKMATPIVENAVVLIGSGLDACWQNDEALGWQLWQNIMQAFSWDEAQVVFYDTAHLASEDMIFSTMEEIIELGVDWVLTMDEEHPMSEQLAEGAHVVEVPDLDLMLSDPYAKKAFYQTVVQLVKAS